MYNIYLVFTAQNSVEFNMNLGKYPWLNAIKNENTQNT